MIGIQIYVTTLYFLIQSLKIQSGRGTWLTSVAKSEMYEHGIATLAICEALQMTGDVSLNESCQAAINHILDFFLLESVTATAAEEQAREADGVRNVAAEEADRKVAVEEVDRLEEDGTEAEEDDA